MGGGKNNWTENLLTGTKDFSGDNWIFGSPLLKEDGTYLGLTVMRKDSAWNNIRAKVVLDVGDYTFSFYVKSTCSGQLQFNNGKHSYYFTDFSNTEFRRHVFNFHVDVKEEMELVVNSTTEDGSIWLCGYKLEHGTNPDPYWNPSTKDVMVRSELESMVGGVNLVQNSKILLQKMNYLGTGVTIDSDNEWTYVRSTNGFSGNELYVDDFFQLSAGLYAFSVQCKTDAQIIATNVSLYSRNPIGHNENTASIIKIDDSGVFEIIAMIHIKTLSECRLFNLRSFTANGATYVGFKDLKVLTPSPYSYLLEMLIKN